MIRRVMAVLAVVLGLVVLVGACSSAPSEAPPPDSAAEGAPATAPSEPVAGEEATAAAESAAAKEPATPPPSEAAPAGPPVIAVTTERGTFEFRTFPEEAPKTVAHVVALVKRNFYNGQRIHRVVPGFVIQWGDPNTRDARLRDIWGTGSSGKPIGVSEWNPKHPHRRGAVAMAHAGDPAFADSQMYVILADSPQARALDGGYTVFGEVISGMDIVLKTRQEDAIKRVVIREESAPAK